MKITEKTSTSFFVDGKPFSTREEAERYIKGKLIESDRNAILNALDFTVHKDHLRLLKHMNVTYYYVEFGAPAIDGKRPYGNSSVIEDLGDILGARKIMVDGEERIPDEAVEPLIHRHLEMKNFLEILCQFGEIPSGRYKRPNIWSAWERC